MSDDKVSSALLDIAGVDERALPVYSRPAWRGMSRATVRSMLGAPAEDRVYDRFNMTLEHMIFERAGQPDVSVFLVGGRVVTKKVGRNLPPDILNLALPLAPDRTNAEIDAETVATEGQLRVGMTTGQVRALYGAPKLLVTSTFKGQPVEHSLFATDAGKSFGSFTFIGGILTEFAITTGLPLSAILWGGRREPIAFSGEVDFRFAVENASNATSLERFPIPSERKALWAGKASRRGSSPETAATRLQALGQRTRGRLHHGLFPIPRGPRVLSFLFIALGMLPAKPLWGTS
jgi:hypothetical protein